MVKGAFVWIGVTLISVGCGGVEGRDAYFKRLWGLVACD